VDSNCHIEMTLIASCTDFFTLVESVVRVIVVDFSTSCGYSRSQCKTHITPFHPCNI